MIYKGYRATTTVIGTTVTSTLCVHSSFDIPTGYDMTRCRARIPVRVFVNPISFYSGTAALLLTRHYTLPTVSADSL